MERKSRCSSWNTEDAQLEYSDCPFLVHWKMWVFSQRASASLELAAGGSAESLAPSNPHQSVHSSLLLPACPVLWLVCFYHSCLWWSTVLWAWHDHWHLDTRVAAINPMRFSQHRVYTQTPRRSRRSLGPHLRFQPLTGSYHVSRHT